MANPSRTRKRKKDDEATDMENKKMCGKTESATKAKAGGRRGKTALKNSKKNVKPDTNENVVTVTDMKKIDLLDKFKYRKRNSLNDAEETVAEAKGATVDQINGNSEDTLDTLKVGHEMHVLDSFQTELLSIGLEERKRPYHLKGFQSLGARSRSLAHFFQQHSLGFKSRFEVTESIRSPIVNIVSNLQLFRVASPFDRRVTAMEWHPTNPNVVAVGSKGGDIILWDTSTVNEDKLIQGIGAAGSCQALKFWPWDSEKVVSASINGTVTLHDFQRNHNDTLADTMNSYDHWYTSLDVNAGRYIVAAGRNCGILHLMSTEGRKIFEYRLHKNKITNCEFSPREEWLLCTASTDQTVAFWDIRNMKDRKSSLQILQHEKPVNSAYFSQTDGCRLLTTDQGSEIRVYTAPTWEHTNTIRHPHRFFQHITPFKATWHPLEDLIVCGRYPDKNFSTVEEPRSIDIIDADSGQIKYQLRDKGADGLCSLNKFSPRGDALASSMGFHILLWTKKEIIEAKQPDIAKKIGAYMADSWQYGGSRSSNSRSRSNISGSRSQPRQQGKKKGGGDTDVDDLKKKKKTKTKKSEEDEIADLKAKVKAKKKKT